MAEEFHGSTRSSLLGPDPHTTNYNPTASDSSSSSFLTTHFSSELIDSSETDNEDDFILQLTRQMEDYMLQEDDDHNNRNNTRVVNNQNRNRNQNRVLENSKRGRRWKMIESTQQIKYYRGRGRRGTSSGSGMRAVFLNRPGSNTGYNGTGVFLPPSANCSTAQSRKIPGCSAALVPTRVLEALEQHFNKMKSLSPLNSLLKTESTHQGQKSGMQPKSRWRSTSIELVEKKLPQEWTY